MTPENKAEFAVLVTSVYAFYRQDCSDFAVSVWWEACKPFDFAAVRSAFNRHAVNPDNGQYMPKPADIVKLLQGTSTDGAMVAWSKVDKAIRQVGTYASVAFDDQIIHAVIQDMGGWVELGRKSEDEWKFVANEFRTRYQGYRTQGGAGDYPRVLVGIAQAQNSQHGFQSQPPVLIGAPEAVKAVIRGGSDAPKIGFHRSSDPELLALVAPRRAVA